MSTLTYNLVLAAASVAIWRDSDGRSAGRLAIRLFGGLLLTSLAAAVGAFAVFGEGPFGIIRLWCWSLFAHLPALALTLAWRRTDSRAARGLAASLTLSLWAVAASAFWLEPTRLEVSRVRLESDEVERPLRLVLVADIQTDRVGPFEREVLARVMTEEPDAVFFAGDFVQAPAARAATEQARLSRVFREAGLSAPLGVWAVDGNTDARGWQRVFDGTDAHLFERSETVASGPLRVTGLTSRTSRRTDLEIQNRPGFHVVLGHYPDYALGDIDADLLLAGHCHGGQIRLPLFGPPLTLSKVPRAWTSGATELASGATLIVSRGIGMERGRAPRLRFLCRPELVVIDVVPSSSSSP